jgi:hypothetical protein
MHGGPTGHRIDWTEATKKVNVKYIREQLARLTLEQISSIWREQIAPPTAAIQQSQPADGRALILP